MFNLWQQWSAPCFSWLEQVNCDSNKNHHIVRDLFSVKNIPVIGPFSDQILALQSAVPAVDEFAYASGQMMQVILEITSKVSYLWLQKIQNHIKENSLEKLDGRALYDLWIGSGEEVYYKVVMTPHYQMVYGRFTNAYMRCLYENQVAVNSFMKCIFIPTQDQFSALAQKVQQHGRVVNSLNLNDYTKIVEQMQTEISQMHDQILSLQKQWQDSLSKDNYKSENEDKDKKNTSKKK